MPHKNKSVTLLELLIVIVIFGLIIVGITSINVFSRHNVVSSDRRTRLQNEVSLCFEHITKQGLRTIGNETIYGANSAVSIVPNTSLSFYVDRNSNGRREDPSLNIDTWVSYTFNPATYRLTFCANCGSSPTCVCTAANTEVISEKIVAFNPTKVANFTQGNHVEVLITARWDPSQPSATASSENPEMNMRAAIDLPSVSTR